MELWLNKEALVPGSLPGSLVVDDRLRRSTDVVQELRGEVTALGGSFSHRTFVVQGPGGSGSSTLARCLSQAVLDGIRGQPGAPRPRVIRVDVRRCKGPHEVAVQLFRAFDPDFSGHGFSTRYLLVLFQRRVRVDGGVGLLWFDNLEKTRNFDRVWEHFLTSTTGPRDPALLFSGDRDPTKPGDGEGPVMRLTLKPFDPDGLYLALEQMTRETFVTLPSPSFLITVRDRMLARGWGISVATSLFRAAGESAEKRRSRVIEERDLPSGRNSPRMRDPGAIDTIVVEGLRECSGSLSMQVHAMQRYLKTRCMAEGIGLPSPSQLRRHLAKLERAHLIERYVRLGGNGGTSSLIALAPSLSGAVTDGSDPALALAPSAGTQGRPRVRAGSGGAVSPVGGRPARAGLSRGPAQPAAPMHA